MDLVKDLMTPDPLVVGPTDTVNEAAVLMETRRIRHVPIADADRRLLGLVSQRDLLRVAWKLSTDGNPESWRAAPIASVMREEVDTVQPSDTAVDAARQILRSKRSCLPVVDADGVLVGILTEADYVRRAVRGD